MPAPGDTWGWEHTRSVGLHAEVVYGLRRLEPERSRPWRDSLRGPCTGWGCGAGGVPFQHRVMIFLKPFARPTFVCGQWGAAPARARECLSLEANAVEYSKKLL